MRYLFRLTTLFMAVLLGGLLLAQPLMAAKTSEFPPGTWRGKAVWTGSIDNGSVQVSVAGAGIVEFELVVAPDGTVTEGYYKLAPTQVNENIASIGAVNATVSGMGNMTGTGALVTGNGNFKIQINSWPLPVAPMDFDSSGDVLGFYPTTASCTFVQGDMADTARQAQQYAGFSTTIKAPFTATRIYKPGEKGDESWDDTYVQLVTEMEQLSQKAKPSVKEVSDLITKVEMFEHNLVDASKCSDAPKNLEKGKQPYDYFLEKFSQLMIKILSDPSGYSGADISWFLTSAIQIGAIGAAAPDLATSEQLEQMFKGVLESKLQEAIAKGDKVDIWMIEIACGQAGYTELWQEAKAAKEQLEKQ